MFLVWHVGLAFLAACAPSGAQTPEPLVKETLLSDVGDRSDIETVKLYRAALNDHDIETALSLLAEDYQLRVVGILLAGAMDELTLVVHPARTSAPVLSTSAGSLKLPSKNIPVPSFK